MSPDAQYLFDAYDAFLSTCAVRINPEANEACALFEAWLERNEIPTADFSDSAWIEFLSSQGVTDANAQFDYLERIAEWGGVLVRSRENARIGRL